MYTYLYYVGVRMKSGVKPVGRGLPWVMVPWSTGRLYDQPHEHPDWLKNKTKNNTMLNKHKKGFPRYSVRGLR